MSGSLNDSIKTVIEDRAANPFWGSFLLAWLTINHNALILYWYSDSFDDWQTGLKTLHPSDGVFACGEHTDWICERFEAPIRIALFSDAGYSFFIYPFVLALALIVIAPIVLALPYYISKQLRRFYAWMRVTVADNEYVTGEQAEKLKQMIAQLKAQAKSDKKQHGDAIDRLRHEMIAENDLKIKEKKGEFDSNMRNAALNIQSAKDENQQTITDLREKLEAALLSAEDPDKVSLTEVANAINLKTVAIKNEFKKLWEAINYIGTLKQYGYFGGEYITLAKLNQNRHLNREKWEDVCLVHKLNPVDFAKELELAGWVNVDEWGGVKQTIASTRIEDVLNAYNQASSAYGETALGRRVDDIEKMVRTFNHKSSIDMRPMLSDAQKAPKLKYNFPKN